MGNPVVHFEITSTGDAAKLQSFYRDLFDWEIDANNPMKYGLVNTGQGDGRIGGGIGPGERQLVTFYVGVPDLQASLDKAESLGGKTVMGVTEVPGYVVMAMIADPEGNVVGLLKV